MNNCPENIDSLSKLPFVFKSIDFEKCHVPSFPPPLFHLTYNKTLESKITFTPNQNKLVLPDSPLVKTSLVSAQRLTAGPDVKENLELTFRFEDEILDYNPGDSFGFLCPNDADEVDLLLNRLSLQNVADAPTNLIFDGESSTRKKLPVNIPPLFSLREIFLHCVEIRAVPKKILFRIIANYTSDEEEKQCLLFLSSPEGSYYFTDLIRQPSLSILDILSHYPSCKPPVEKIIECLPPLRPRFYSVTSSPLVDKQRFRILFNVLKIKKSDGRQMDREGVCTGWLSRLASDMLVSSSSNISDTFASLLKLDNDPKIVFVYKRKNLQFKFPEKLKVPLIMVGPGTGIAPFIGYLQHREALMKSHPDKQLGETWLFYGCRHKEKDFLYKTELDRLLECKVLQYLVPSFSRDTEMSDAPKYVQDSIMLNAQQLADTIKLGKILVCGDARNMAPGVQKSFIKALQIGSGVNEAQAETVIKSMQKENRYVNDVWA